MPVVGLAVAGLAIAFAEGSGKSTSEVLFSGQNALGPLILHSAGYTAGALVLLLACKGLAYGASLSSFRGGPIFPSMFLGAAGGVALSHLPGLPLVPAVAMGIGAMSTVMLRLPLTSALLPALLLSTDGLAVTPLIIVAVVVAYVVSARLAPGSAPGRAGGAGRRGRASAGSGPADRACRPVRRAGLIPVPDAYREFPASSPEVHPRSAMRPARPVPMINAVPNVLYLVWDDAGIATWNAFGGLIDAPYLKWLAGRGLRYSQWHTPARSEPTRGSLLTGRDGTAGRGARVAAGDPGPGWPEHDQPAGFRHPGGDHAPRRLPHVLRGQVGSGPGGGGRDDRIAQGLAARPRL